MPGLLSNTLMLCPVGFVCPFCWELQIWMRFSHSCCSQYCCGAHAVQSAATASSAATGVSQGVQTRFRYCFSKAMNGRSCPLVASSAHVHICSYHIFYSKRFRGGMLLNHRAAPYPPGLCISDGTTERKSPERGDRTKDTKLSMP